MQSRLSPNALTATDSTKVVAHRNLHSVFSGDSLLIEEGDTGCDVKVTVIVGIYNLEWWAEESHKMSICWDSATKRRNTKASGQNVALGSPKNSFQKSKYKILDTMTLLWHDRGNRRIEHF